MKCEYCGEEMKDTVKFCPNCGAPAPKAAPAAEPATQPVTQATPAAAAPTVNATMVNNQGVTGWKTDVAMSVLGGVVLAILAGGGNLINTTVDSGLMCLLAAAGLVYALVVYPKFFEPEGFAGKSSQLFSFLNIFLGGIIFGCIWNHNLTTNNKGISYIVFTVLTALALLRYLTYFVGI